MQMSTQARSALGLPDLRPRDPAPRSAYLVEVAPSPDRHRYSHCSSSACVVDIRSQPGNVWPDRHPGAASVGVADSGLRGAAGSLSLQPLQPVGHGGRALTSALGPSLFLGKTVIWATSGEGLGLTCCLSSKRWLQEGSRKGGN